MNLTVIFVEQGDRIFRVRIFIHIFSCVKVIFTRLNILCIIVTKFDIKWLSKIVEKAIFSSCYSVVIQASSIENSQVTSVTNFSIFRRACSYKARPTSTCNISINSKSANTSWWCQAYNWVVLCVVSHIEFFHYVRNCSAILVVATLGVCLTMPLVLITCSYIVLFMLAAVDSQVQGYNTITTISSNGAINILTALCVSFTIPSVTITSNYRLFCILRIVDGQVQGHNAIAAVGSSCHVNVIATCCVSFAIPSITITSSNSLLYILRLVDSQVEGYNTVAASYRRDCIDVCT